MRRAAILLDFLPNHRFTKRIEFEKNLFDLHLICRNRGIDDRTMTGADGYTVHEFNIKSSGNPVTRLPQYFLYARKARKLLDSIRPELIHVQGVDMLKIAYGYKKKHADVKVIYEVGDLHKLIVDRQTNPVLKIVQSFLLRKDRRYASCCDMLIVTSMKFYEDYFSAFIPEEKLLYMPNVPDLKSFASYKRKTDGPFTVGFIGNVRYRKQIRNLIDAGDALNIHLLIVGYEAEPREIEALCKDKPNIEQSGRFDFDSQVAELYGKCDVMYSIYDADMKNVTVALPNKLYEAVYCEMPLIVAKDTYLAQIVDDWGVGVAVDHREPDELIQALDRLRNDRDFYDSIVENCKKHKAEIDLQMYNDVFRQRLEALMK